MRRYRLGIDLGGTKIEIVALAADGHCAWRQRVATPRGDYRGTLRAIAALVADAEAALGVTPGSCTAGIGTPGSLSPQTRRLRNSNSVCLNGEPIVDDLQALLRREVRIANDANCFAMSEAADGAGAGHAVVFGVILGTGVGAGIVVHGSMLAGCNGIAGEWGHNPLPWPRDDERPGRPCYCGRAGCIETWLSGPALEFDHGQATRQPMAAQAVVARAAAGDVAAGAALARYEERLARALAHVINILDPDVIVLGGGMSNADSLYTRVPETWGRWIFSDHVTTRLVRNAHGDSSGVRGAACLWPA
ncbi:MAG: ROK family protein [Burkholderiales bacterium]|nr:ROK family protein [Burkholderiales bacterium]